MNIEDVLKNAGKRITPERKAIFEFLEKKHIFSSADILENFPHLWRASIFRTLNLFLEIGILRRVYMWEKWESYEINEQANHHEHMVCQKCKSILNFDSENICKKIFEEAEKMGFSIKEHSVNILWICKKCNS